MLRCLTDIGVANRHTSVDVHALLPARSWLPSDVTLHMQQLLLANGGHACPKVVIQYSDKQCITCVLMGEAFCSSRQHVPVAEFKQNLHSMIEHLRKSNISSIILIAPPPLCEEGRIQHNCQVRFCTQHELTALLCTHVAPALAVQTCVPHNVM